MQDPLGVRGVERAGDLNGQRHRGGGGQRAAQRRAVDVLHHQIVRADVVERADVGMIQRRDRARLLREALAVLGLAAA